MQSAATTPRPCEKREPIPVPFSVPSTNRNGKAVPCAVLGTKGKGELPKRVENRRLSALLGPARERRSPAAAAAKSPARKRRIASRAWLHHVKGAEEWAAARKRRVEKQQNLRSLCQKIRFLRKSGLIKSSQSAIIILVICQDTPAGLFSSEKVSFPRTHLRALYHIPFYTA